MVCVWKCGVCASFLLVCIFVWMWLVCVGDQVHVSVCLEITVSPLSYCFSFSILLIFFQPLPALESHSQPLPWIRHDQWRRRSLRRSQSQPTLKRWSQCAVLICWCQQWQTTASTRARPHPYTSGTPSCSSLASMSKWASAECLFVSIPQLKTLRFTQCWLRW